MIGRMTMTNEAYPIVCRHAANTAGRDFVVGDLHGCVDALRYLLREIVFDAACDRLFSVGDLIDRGSQSDEALALLDKPWFFPVLGNHEEALCLVAEGAMRQSTWNGLGGEWAQALPDQVLRAYARRLRTLPLVRVVGSGARRFNVIHAEFFGDDAALDSGLFTERVRQQLLWGRELALGSGVVERQAGLSPTYCGHTPMREIGRIGAQIFIDTGAFAATGKLSVTEALTARAWSVSVAHALDEGAHQMSLP
ncbi:metallophosphoesterase [Trinickia dabaoshanensis]|uniref:Metallophosphoesterase n=2 Tax=Trinickia dabaoshanensis TaxID=564714 RepID=A0A2N7VKP7_9BURK|nr:metallophosphoesterase [Trinickia dabaoshanensis]